MTPKVNVPMSPKCYPNSLPTRTKNIFSLFAKIHKNIFPYDIIKPKENIKPYCKISQTFFFNKPK